MSEMSKHDPDRCACRWGEQPCQWCWPDASPHHGAQAPQDGANGGDVGSGKGEGLRERLEALVRSLRHDAALDPPMRGRAVGLWDAAAHIEKAMDGAGNLASQAVGLMLDGAVLMPDREALLSILRDSYAGPEPYHQGRADRILALMPYAVTEGHLVDALTATWGKHDGQRARAAAMLAHLREQVAHQDDDEGDS